MRAAAAELLAAATPDDGDVAVLVAPMVHGNRELIAGLLRDPQFGPTVMLGVGGILAEAVADVAFRPAPVDEVTAGEMIDQLATQRLLGPFRGEAAVDRDALAAVLVGLGRVGAERDDVASVDVNPLIVTPAGLPVAVDALVELGAERPDATGDVATTPPRARPADRGAVPCAVRAPRGGRDGSVHPSRQVRLRLPAQPAGQRVRRAGLRHQPRRRGGARASAPWRSVDELPMAEIDLVFVCTPAAANLDVLRACAAKGVRAAFLTSAGYGEAGDAGRRAEAELVALADELGMLLAGPNGQGVVSTPANLCAQIVAPYPPAGSIGVASQSGNFVSSFLNLALASGVGISRAVSAGNAAAVTVADYLDFYADDPATSVALAYVEGIADGRGLMRPPGIGGRRASRSSC